MSASQQELTAGLRGEGAVESRELLDALEEARALGEPAVHGLDAEAHGAQEALELALGGAAQQQDAMRAERPWLEALLPTLHFGRRGPLQDGEPERALARVELDARGFQLAREGAQSRRR